MKFILLIEGLLLWILVLAVAGLTQQSWHAISALISLPLLVALLGYFMKNLSSYLPVAVFRDMRLKVFNLILALTLAGLMGLGLKVGFLPEGYHQVTLIVLLFTFLVLVYSLFQIHRKPPVN